ncbi:NUDIX hydrolase [Sulfitobacter albidus]|uniref:NUDIX hydrolase n=1 Tax=Sulfitobacter albidus TaxID=2829501 RepID=A0A975PML5_9RHOB|nr:NUDIX hydrolase [Sulfitobacter albidus]QUJ76551.1 NUDIX hydrolase [Sulfitobacter albidus]
MANAHLFNGAKLALYMGTRLAVILRDDTPGLAFRNCWDLPGGGREGRETPLACALRECREELGLRVPARAIVWQRCYPAQDGARWFFVARMPRGMAHKIRLGEEGQRFMLMSEDIFLRHPDAIPAFRGRVAAYRRWRKSRG